MKKMFVLLWVLCFCILSFAQTEESVFNLDTDIAVFRHLESVNLLEIHYALYPDEWQYKLTKGDSSGAVLVELRISRDGMPLHSDRWKMVHQKTSQTSTEGKRTIKLDVIRLKIQPGKYQVRLNAMDLYATAKMDSSITDIIIQKVPDDKVSISDIVLCSEIRDFKPGDPKLFKKGSFYTLTNPNHIFSGDDESIHFYTEIYQTGANLKGNTYSINCFIADDDGNLQDAIDFNEKVVNKIENNIFHTSSLAISEIPSGTYWLNIEILDHTGEKAASKRQQFYVFNPKMDSKRKDDLALRSSGASMFGSTFTIDENSEMEYITYLFTKDEKKLAEHATTTDGKKAFLSQFWASRDPDPETPVNEFRNIYLERVKYTNQQDWGYQEGWKSDMGRVYILYGPPSNQEKNLQQADQNAYITWIYDDIEGGVEFIFVSFEELQKNFELVHSTKRGEIRDYNWQRRISVNPIDRGGITF